MVTWVTGLNPANGKTLVASLVQLYVTKIGGEKTVYVVFPRIPV